MTIPRRLLIFVEGGLVQALLTPDEEDDFDVIIKDVDNEAEIQGMVFRYPIDKALSEEEWSNLERLADSEEEEEDD